MFEWYDTSEKSTLERIAYASELYYSQKAQVEKAKYLENLLFKNFVNQIKSISSKYEHIPFTKAQDELTIKDKRKSKPTLKLLKNFLAEDFFNGENIEIISIIRMGNEAYAWEIEFQICGLTYYLKIPQYKNIHITNVKYANFGQFTLMIEKTKGFRQEVISSYNTKDIADYINKIKENNNG